MRKRKYVSLDNDDDASNTTNNNNNALEYTKRKYRRRSGAVRNIVNKIGGVGGGGDDDDNNNDDDSEDDNDDDEKRCDVGGENNDDGDYYCGADDNNDVDRWYPIPKCHNIVSTSQILTSQSCINLQKLADFFPYTTYDRKRFAAITIRLANPHCTCLLFGSGKLVITGSTSFSACIVASHEITKILREANPRDWFEVKTCVIQNIVAHVELPRGTTIDLEKLYSAFCECSTYQKTIFPGLVLRPPQSPIVLLIFTSGRIVCTGGRSYEDIYFGFKSIFETIKSYIHAPATTAIP
jgi:transcription initiation factor TFIID TATA-box-binding protein